MQPADVFCRDSSLAAHEPLAGTAAAETELWLALEVETPWGPKGLEDSALAPRVVQRLTELVTAQPRARVQLIRKPERGAQAPCLYLAHSGEQARSLQRVSLGCHEDLLDLDLEAFARGESVSFASQVSEPLYLVCVHGKRDRCCAQHGMPVYSALSALAPEHTWQTTHLGGHRFAATMLVLPDGISYGRVLEAEAVAIVAAHARGELYDLERLRGRTSYTAEAQAADYWLRTQLGERRLDALSLVACEAVEGGQRIRFRDQSGGEHVIEVAREALGAVAASCGAQPKPVDRWVALRRSAAG